MREKSKRYRSSIYKPVYLPRGIFGGNKSVKYGLIAIFACILIAQFYIRLQSKKLTGPIDDVFRRDPDRLIMVYSTTGKDAEALREYTLKVSGLLRKVLSNEVLVYPDTSVDKELLENYSLLLYGPVEENLVSAKLKEYFPFKFGGGGVSVGQRYIDENNWRMVFVVPNPVNQEHYLLVYTGATSADVIGINLFEHPNYVHHDTTDYVLAIGKRIEAQGYFDKSSSTHWIFPQ